MKTSATRAIAGTPTPAPTKIALVAVLALTAVALAAFLAKRPEAAIDAALAAGLLWLFTAIFLVRVAGQVVARRWRPTWLPPTDEWNLTPYRLLLPAQLAILGVMIWIDVDLSRAAGAAATPRPALGEAVIWFAYVYVAAIAIRYGVRMTRRPEARWFGGTIPIVFHVVLAAYLFVLGSYHASY
jgi:hypothetical protein